MSDFFSEGDLKKANESSAFRLSETKTPDLNPESSRLDGSVTIAPPPEALGFQGSVAGDPSADIDKARIRSLRKELMETDFNGVAPGDLDEAIATALTIRDLGPERMGRTMALGTEAARSVSAEFPLTFKEPKYIDQDEAQAIEARYLMRLKNADPEAYNEIQMRTYLESNFGDGNYPVLMEDAKSTLGGPRTAVKFLQGAPRQADALQKKFGATTRVVDDNIGNLHVMVLEPKEDDPDVKVWRFMDAPRTTPSDYLDFYSELYPTGGAIVGGVGGTAASGGNVAVGAAGAAGGGFVAGAAQDAVARTLLGVDIEPVEIAKRRGLEVGISFPIDLVTGGLTSKVISFSDLPRITTLRNGSTIFGGRVRVPFRGGRIRTFQPQEGDPLAVKGMEDLESIKMIHEATGIDLSRDMNLAQLSSDPTLIDLAIFTARQPIVGRGLARDQRKTVEALNRVKEKITGTGPFQDTELGKALVSAVDRDVTLREGAIGKALASAESMVDATVNSQLGTAGINLSAIDMPNTGYLLEAVYFDAFSRTQATKNALYQAARDLEPAGGVVPVSAVRKAMTAETYNAMPEALRRQLRVAEDVAEEGADAAAAGVRSAAASEADDKMIPFDTLVELRSRVRDKMNSGFIAPGEGMNMRDLTRVADDISKLIDDVATTQGSSEFRAAAQKANQFYKDEFLPFSTPDIRRVLEPRDVTKSVGNSGMALLEQFTMGGGGRAVEQYRQLQRVLDSQGVAGSKQLLRQGILQAAKSEGGADYVGRTINRNIIDADRFLKRLEKMEPEIMADIFNTQTSKQARDEMVKAAKVLREMQGKGFGGRDFDFDDFLRRVDQGDSFSKAIEKAAANQIEVDKLYRFQQSLISRGGMQGSTFNPKEFTEVLVDQASTPNDITLVKNILRNSDEKLVDQVERHYLRGLFNEAVDPVSGKLSSDRLANTILEKENMIRALIGNDGLQLAKHYQNVVAKASKMDAMETGASIAKGQAQGNILEVKGGSNPLAFIQMVRKNVGSFTFSMVVRSDVLKEAVKRGYGKKLSAIELSIILGSDNVLRAMQEEFPEGSPEHNDYIQGLIDLNRQARREEIDRIERQGGFVTERMIATPDVTGEGLDPQPQSEGFFGAEDVLAQLNDVAEREDQLPV